jgi:hypothetical protein
MSRKVSIWKPPGPKSGAHPPLPPGSGPRTVLDGSAMLPHRVHMHPGYVGDRPENAESPVDDRAFVIAGAGFEPATFGL